MPFHPAEGKRLKSLVMNLISVTIGKQAALDIFWQMHKFGHIPYRKLYSLIVEYYIAITNGAIETGV
jgi:hypothetical protein